MTSATHILKIVVQVFDKATAQLSRINQKISQINKPIASITDAVSKSQSVLGGWVNPIDAVTSKFKNVGNSVKGVANPLFLMKDNIRSISAAVAHSQTKLKGWQSPIDVVNAKLSKSKAKMINFDQAVRKTTNSIGKINKKMNTFDMRLLSVMFGGMALSRLFGGITRNIINTFIKAEDHTSGLTNATTRLSASWEFMKFSIMDALNTDFFLAIIDNIVKFINWISNLINKFPILGQALILAFGALAVGGAIMMTIAQFKLFWDATFGVGGFLAKKVVATTTAIKGLDTALITLKATAAGISFTGLIAVLGGVAVAAATAYAAMKVTQGLIAQFVEPEGAPSISDVAAHPVDNIDILNDSIGGTTQEYSNMRSGMDSTLQIVNKFDEKTGKLTSHILTQGDIVNGVTTSGSNFLVGNQNIVKYNNTIIGAFDTLTGSIQRQVEAYLRLAEAKRAARSYYAGEDVDYFGSSSVSDDEGG